MVEKWFVNDESNSGAYGGFESGKAVTNLAICKVGKFFVGDFPLVDFGIKLFATGDYRTTALLHQYTTMTI